MIFESMKKLGEAWEKEEKDKEQRLENYVANSTDNITKLSSFLPLKSGSSGGYGHRIETNNQGNIFLKKIRGVPSGIYYIILILGGIFGLFFYRIGFTSEVLLSMFTSESALNLVFIFIFIIFVIFKGIMTVFGGTSYVFDFQNGYFYDTKYTKKLFELSGSENYLRKIIPINQIHALQIITKNITGSRNIYSKFELNIILKDSTRLYLTENSDLKIIKAAAQIISEKLRIKIYDAMLV